jgi:ATP-dependent Zn protease
MTGPTVRQTAWHEAGHAVVAWDRGFTVTLVSIRPDGRSLGRSQHVPAGDCTIASERQRENIVAMAGWAAELASGEAKDSETYDSGDLTSVLNRTPEDRINVELGWAESEAQRIVFDNLDRVERLAHELMRREELTCSAEILDIIEGRPPSAR